MISIAASPIYIPISSIKMVPVSHILANICFLFICFVFLMITILTGVRWELNEVLISVSLVAKDVKQFIMLIGHFHFIF